MPREISGVALFLLSLSATSILVHAQLQPGQIIPSQTTHLDYRIKWVEYYGRSSCKEPSLQSGLFQNCSAEGGFPASTVTCNCVGCNEKVIFKCQESGWYLHGNFNCEAEKSGCMVCPKIHKPKRLECNEENVPAGRLGDTHTCKCTNKGEDVSMTCKKGIRDESFSLGTYWNKEEIMCKDPNAPCDFENTASTDLICQDDYFPPGSRGQTSLCLCKHTCQEVNATCEFGFWQHNCNEQLQNDDKSIEKCVTCPVVIKHPDLVCDVRANKIASFHGDVGSCICKDTCSRTSVTCDNGEWRHDCPDHRSAEDPNETEECVICQSWRDPPYIRCDNNVIEPGVPGESRTCRCQQHNFNTTVTCDENGRWGYDCEPCYESKVPDGLLCEEDIFPEASPGETRTCRSKQTCLDKTMICSGGRWRLYEDIDKATLNVGDYVDNLKRTLANGQYQFECRPGYILEGASSLTCREGEQSAEFPRCVPQGEEKSCKVSFR